MKLNIYSIFDNASGLYSRPWFAASDAEASRAFSDIATDAEHPVGQHPEDYTLYRLGTFDDATALLNNEANEMLCTALERCSAARSVDQRQMALLDGTKEVAQ